MRNAFAQRCATGMRLGMHYERDEAIVLSPSI